jgi:hypothetical protein
MFLDIRTVGAHSHCGVKDLIFGNAAVLVVGEEP